MNQGHGSFMYGNEGASVNGKPPVSKTGTAGSIPAAPVVTERVGSHLN